MVSRSCVSPTIPTATQDRGNLTVTSKDALVDTYLDIETTGLYWPDAEITVVGLYLVNPGDGRLVQLVGKDVTKANLLEALSGVQSIFTYNGSRFDLPSLGVDLTRMFAHRDLMYHCWRCNLYGGFKAVERQLGIPRQLQGITGWDAVRLWYRYIDSDDQEALDTLLRYNREDVMNLKVLRERLPANREI